jgi:hypothetical protein
MNSGNRMISVISAFLLMLMASTTNTITALVHSNHPSRVRQRTNNMQPLYIMWDPKNNDEQINSELVDFPTPAQKMELKKEASKRQARKKIISFSLPQEESFGNFSDETLKELWNLLGEDEIIEVRGIAKDEKKVAFQVATRLCLELEFEQERKINDKAILPVALLWKKGHSAVLYSPTLDLDHPKKFLLRTSVGQKNTWTERSKSPRDFRGQIVKE